MDQKIENIQIKDLPEELLDKILEEIKLYAISLLGVKEELSGEDLQLLGSGTLVKIENKYCILTAQHVTPLLRKFKKIGLNLGTFEHRLVIDSFLPIVKIGSSIGNPLEQDLAIITLPEYIIGTIKAKKLFWDISYHKDIILSKPIDLTISLCFLCGTIAEWTKIEVSSGAFGKVVGFRNLCGPTGIEEYWIKQEFDYLKLSVRYENRTELPESFGGASGGGIWRVVLQRLDDGNITYSKPQLIGVAFYETEIQDDMRSIIGHGWRSIYEVVPNKCLDCLH